MSKSTLINTIAIAIITGVFGLASVTYRETIALRAQVDDLEARVTRDEVRCREAAVLTLDKFAAVDTQASATAANVARLEGTHARGND